MAAPLKTTIPILQGLSEALEDTSTKIRRARDELKDLRAEAREAKKAGAEVSAASQQRMSTLQEQIQQLKYQQVAERIAKQGRTRGVSDALGSAQGLIGNTMRIGTGNVGLMDVGNLGSLMQRAGTGLISSGRLGATGARMGAQLARVGTGLASGAAAALPFVGAAAAGYGIGQSIGAVGTDYFERRGAASNSRAAIEDQISQLQRPGAFGGRMAYDDRTMQRIRNASIKSQQPTEDAMIRASFSESLQRRFLGSFYSPSKQIDAATTASANLAMRLEQAGVQDPNLRRQIDDIDNSSAFRTELDRQLRSKSIAGRIAAEAGRKGGLLNSILSNETLRRINPINSLVPMEYLEGNYDVAVDEVRQKERERLIRSEEAQRRREEFIASSPANRIASQETDRTINRVEADRMRRHLDWNQI